jgi:dTDP-4-dehydrorhamnose 3,5-epimerase
MGWVKTEFEGVYIFEPKVWSDERGYFVETFNTNSLEGLDINPNFVQDNEAKSTRGVLRGLHYQCGENSQSKLVRVVTGKILDVIVDLRVSSKTYGKQFGIILDDIHKKQLYVPRGLAHGYVVLSEEAIFSYKCDNHYNKASEGGLAFDDPSLGIDWVIKKEDLIISEKDKVNPKFGNHKPSGI